MAEENKSEVKHIADIIGEWGKWQFHLFVFFFFLSATGAFINMGYSFSAKTVDFWCSDVPQEYLTINNSTDKYKCTRYRNPDEICTEWTYNTTQFKKSLITEFNLVCDRSNYGSITQACFMLGYVVSGLVVSHLSDKYGRRLMALLCFIIEIVGLISCGLSVNIYQYIISRFLVGLGHSGGGYSLFSLLVECCGPKHRSEMVMLPGVGWVVGYIIIPGFAFWLEDFRYLTLISIIPMIIIIIWLWFLYESPRWLITNGKVDRAEQIIRKVLITNGKPVENLTEQMRQLTQNLQEIDKQGELQKSHNLMDLVKTPNLRKYTFILWYQWIINALIYYGISFNMSDFGGNFYITFFLGGLAELPSQLVTPLLLRFIGRKTLYSIFMFLISVSVFAVIPSQSEWLRVTLALISKYAVSSSWSIIAIYASEIYPTIIRTTGIGVGSVVGRIGSISAPFMGNLTMNTSLTFVMTFYGILTTIGGLLALLLPETKDRELPDTVDEAEHFDSIEMKIANEANK